MCTAFEKTRGLSRQQNYSNLIRTLFMACIALLSQDQAHINCLQLPLKLDLRGCQHPQICGPRSEDNGKPFCFLVSYRWKCQKRNQLSGKTSELFACIVQSSWGTPQKFFGFGKGPWECSCSSEKNEGEPQSGISPRAFDRVYFLFVMTSMGAEPTNNRISGRGNLTALLVHIWMNKN